MESRDIHCAFVEMDTDRCEYLQNHLMPFQAISGVNYSIACTPFSEGIDELAKQRPEFFTGRLPMFAFIDPFGATGAPFSVVYRLLASPRSEVFINFDVDAVARIFGAGDHARHEDLLGDIFGDNEWRSEFERFSSDFPNLWWAILAAYKTRLWNLPRVRASFSFEMTIPILFLTIILSSLVSIIVDWKR
ncbi:MAG: three-Cys-motif partner protein TcmP [Thermomicrobiales bacterium]